MNKPDKRLQEAFQRWRDHPAAMVRELFHAEPDIWQEQVLEAFPHTKRIALKASKGPGKTACLAWLVWNYMLTRPSPNILGTSISGDNLKDGLIKEISKWHSKMPPQLQSAFVLTNTRVESKQDPKNWFFSARTWPKSGTPEEQANTLAGFHAEYTLVLLDEAGGIPDAVMAAAEGALTTGVESHIIIAGNPTHREGPLFRACTTERHLWKVWEINSDPDDPNRNTRVGADYAREQLEKYGRDHPYYIVNVLGNFPPYSFNALLTDDDVRAAQARMYREFDMAQYPRILGIDVARGGPDKSVIARRHGRQLYSFIARRNVESGQEGARLTNRVWEDFRADAAFIDGTGGYGLTWYDCLRDLGRTAIPIGFATRATQDDRYENKRAEMYFSAAQWIKEGGALPPPDTEEAKNLARALVDTTFTFKKNSDRLILEDKEDIKTRIGFSPDEADAFALTFAEPVSAKTASPIHARTSYNAAAPYQPFAEMDRMMQLPIQGAVSRYDPFSGDR